MIEIMMNSPKKKACINCANGQMVKREKKILATRSIRWNIATVLVQRKQVKKYVDFKRKKNMDSHEGW